MSTTKVLVSIHDIKKQMLSKRYGSCYRVYRSFDIDLLLRMWNDLHYLCELYTRTKLVPSNEEFRTKKAIPHYNSLVKRLQEKYPNIREFHNYKTI
jgi:hypothetical protein